MTQDCNVLYSIPFQIGSDFESDGYLLQCERAFS